MRATIILIAVLLSFSNRLTAQTKNLYGRVVDEDLEALPGVRIQNKDKLLLGTTGMDGRFRIDISQNTQTLLLSFIGFDRTTIKLNSDCDTVEVVMMLAGTFDFISSRKIDRLRLESFNKLTELYLQAYKKGLFMKESACYTREFEPDKPQLDSIEKEEVKIRRQIKLTFERLTMGDTIKIPFSGESRSYQTNSIILSSNYSIFADKVNYDCIIKCVITGKNKRKRHYNIVCKVVDSELCKYPSVVNGSAMKIGDVFTYNMKYFKILDE